jgi:double-stranded uracil-DNA glycosylase
MHIAVGGEPGSVLPSLTSIFIGYNTSTGSDETKTAMATRQPRSPSREELERAAGRTLEDIIAPGLRVLFCGINPGLYSGYTGHHFARPGNRFWPTIHRAGFTERQLTPAEERLLLDAGLGVTNLVERATATAAELTPEEIRAGGERLLRKVERFRPETVAVLGVSAYRVAFDRPRARIGRQPEPLGPAQLWVLPNPSGLNAHYTPAALAQVYREFRLTLTNNGGSEEDQRGQSRL